jgi:hypothetical protein
MRNLKKKNKTIKHFPFLSTFFFLITSPIIRGDDPEFIKRQDQKRSDLDEQLKEYINEWRKQRAKEEDELKKLKDKQAKRKVSRAEEEKRMAHLVCVRLKRRNNVKLKRRGNVLRRLRRNVKPCSKPKRKRTRRDPISQSTKKITM